MELLLDLRLSPAPVQDPGARRLTLDELAALLRRGAGLRELLRDVLRATRHERIRVFLDARPQSSIEAGGVLVASLGRARRFELVSGGTARTLRPTAFRLWAAAGLARAVPWELAHLLTLLRDARRVAREPGAPRPLPRAPRRVLYIRSDPSILWMGTYVGGAATHTNGVIRGLAAKGLDVHVLSPERPPGVDGVPCTELPPTERVHLIPWLTSFAHTRRFADAAAAHPADLVYQRYALGSYAGVAAARRLGVPLVLEYNGSEVWATKHWGAGWLPLSGLLAELERRNVREAALVVVVSEPLRDQLLAQGVAPERILVNPNGVDLDALAPYRTEDPATWRARLGRPEAPTVGFIGTFGQWHGAQVIPELAGLLARARPDARWLLVGDGPLRDQVRADLAARGLLDRVELTGVVEHEAALRLLAACDVFVSPHVPNPDGTPFFGSPTKLFEYMGLGRPVVASALDQIGEVIEDGRTGLLCPPGDAAAAAAALDGLLGDPQRRAALAEAALAEARERFTWEAHVGRILDAVRGERQPVATG